MTHSRTIDTLTINACFPRSGHRYLRQLLARYYGKNFHFLESHHQDMSALTKAQLANINYVKTHDFKLEGERILSRYFQAERNYLIQLRHPILTFCSYYEFALKHGHIKEDSNANWQSFVKAQFDYWRRFVDIWIGTSTHIVLYEDLLTQPESTLSRIINFLSPDRVVDKDAIEHSVNTVPFLQYVGDKSSQKVNSRSLTSFKYFDPEKFTEWEQRLYSDYMQPAGISRLMSR